MQDIKLLASAIRFLSIDAVEKAQSGHPGMPLGMADIATVLWHKFLRHNPENPLWFNRDRFVLSNGHGSMLLYSLLHLTGYKLTITDLQNFRQLHSKTPGHPESTETPGVETTTGPLGQGLANAVGMAIAEQNLAAQFNLPNLTLIDHFTYVFVGDGCLMEGISHEACSLAGTLGLGKLIAFYDDNGISIDGEVSGWFTDDTIKRFQAYDWQVIGPIDGFDPLAIEQAIYTAQQETQKPSLIICKTIIGHGSKVAGSEKTHGAPLGNEDIQGVRNFFNWPHIPFEISKDVYAAWNRLEEGQKLEQQWLEICAKYKELEPTQYFEFLRRINGDLPDDWESRSEEFIKQCCNANIQSLATRKASQQCLEFYAAFLPEMIGGSADLTSSNNTDWSGTKVISRQNFKGNYIHYGVREFAMSAIMNGLALHGGIIPYGGTFLVFADYARNAVRLSSIMHRRVIFVYTHDSIGLGEDGPTHQPIEHLAMLRMTPAMHVWRPADLVETAVAWQQALEYHYGPSCLIFSRQNLPMLFHSEETTKLIKRGGYIFHDCDGQPDVILISNGSELHLALESAKLAQKNGWRVRVVSMPCVERFLAQEKSYQESVLPGEIRKRIAIEAAATPYWYRFVGLDGAVIGIDQFGLSGPGKDVYNFFGITVDKIIEKMQELLS